MENPSYYAVIPANVRYDTRLTPNAKLLFAEITCLSNKTGICYASNKYFADLYSVSTTSISKWINQLVEFNYISTTMVYKEGSKEIQSRYISMCVDIKESDVSIKKVVKKKEIDLIDYTSLLEFFNKVTGKSSKSISDKTKSQLNARIKDGYTKKDIANAIINCHKDDWHQANPKYLTLEFISRPDKFEKYVSSIYSGLTDEQIRAKKRTELRKEMGI